jgi:N-methylhydantoinase A
VTDANLLLGRLLEDSPLAGDVTLSRSAAEEAVAGLAGELGLDVLGCAEGIVRVAETEMLAALRVMTVERGIDPRAFALLPFGGAGPLHAAALAEALGISRILCPRASGVLCALGLAAAAPRRDVARTVMLRGGALSAAALARERRALVREAGALLGDEPRRVRARHELRYRGQSFELPVEEELGPDGDVGLGPDDLRAAFADAHELRYGYRDAEADVELVNLRVSVWGAAPPLRPRSRAGAPTTTHVRPVVFAGRELSATVHVGEPPPGAVLAGPALCALPESTLLIPPGWSGDVDEHGTIRLERMREE